VAKKLGRGLSHLLGGGSDPGASPAENRHPEYQELPLGEIQPNPDQPRKRFPPEEIEELSRTLKSVGLIEPVIVRKLKDGGYQLISGERRYRACKLAGFKKIPAIIKQLGDAQAMEIAIIENIQREDLTPIEEARAYEQLMNHSGIKPSQLAARVGKDRTTITNLLRLLRLPEPILQLIEEKKITAGQARPLLALGDRSAMNRIAHKIVLDGWSARRVEEEVARLTEGSAAGSGKSQGGKTAGRRDANIKSLEEKLRKKLMAKVSLEHTKKGGGKLTVHYGNLDDLDRILEIFGVK